MRNLMFALVLCVPACAQTAAIPAAQVTIPARVIPSQTLTVNVPRNGGKMSFVIPSQTLPAQTSSTAPATAPVTLGPATYTFTCSGPDLEHLTCTAVKQAPIAIDSSPGDFH